MAYIDIDQLFKCETCYHNSCVGCTTYCECGESYRPAMSKLNIVDAVELHDCNQCKYHYRTYADYPCNNCRNCYTDKFEQKEV